MHWHLSHRADPFARLVADRHYNRQKIGAPQFVPPGRCLVLYAENRRGCRAFWVTSYPFAEYVRHAWAGAWVCSAFRNEGFTGLSSELIREALACSRNAFGDPPPLGMVTFVKKSAVTEKADPGRCFLEAGFEAVGTTKGGLLAFLLAPEKVPAARKPRYPFYPLLG